jgi:hypothetical protein
MEHFIGDELFALANIGLIDDGEEGRIRVSWVS